MVSEDEGGSATGADTGIILAEQVSRRIYTVRGLNVLLDSDLAELYGVPTKSLNLAVKRNEGRFPSDRGENAVKFVCYKEFDDPREPVLPGIFHKGKTLPLARVVAVAEALAPKGLSVPGDINQVIGRLTSYAGAVRDLEKARVLDKLWQEAGVTAMAPLPSPHRILAIGRNYSEHAKEMDNEVPDEPIVFQKASTSVIADGRPIVLPLDVGRVDFEGELAVVIGTAGRNVPEDEALSLVAGYTLINDVTARDEQKRAIGKSLPWFLSKSYDTFGPLGPYLVTPDEVPDPQNLQITLSVNGEVRQQANTSEMLFSIPYLISYLSRRFALAPGDVIATGTPPGVGPLKAGDLVEVRIAEIGTLTNPVVSEDEVF